MYPEGGGGAAPAGDYYPEGGIKSRIAYHLEGLIPLILILIIAFFLAIKFDIITTSTPVIGIVADIFEGGERPVNMLIIGQTSQEVIDVLDSNPKLVNYRIKTPEALTRSPKDQLRQYEIVMLDQSEEANKEVSYELGRAIEDYVKTGGKFILVLDSAIRRPGAYDVLGWKNTFRDIVPVDCVRQGINDMPACIDPIIVRGNIIREDMDHPIMEGIEIVPADPGLYIVVTTFNVNPTGKEIAYIEDFSTKKSYPGIVEKRLFVGKSLYFNYNPGKTKGILESTIRYLR